MENIAAELEKIANRVISERRIESAVYVDEDAMFACDSFIKSRINELFAITIITDFLNLENESACLN